MNVDKPDGTSGDEPCSDENSDTDDEVSAPTTGHAEDMAQSDQSQGGIRVRVRPAATIGTEASGSDVRPAGPARRLVWSDGEGARVWASDR